MAFPSDVLIREVGPRDGFQNEREVIPTDEKVRLIDMLARTGVRRLEEMGVATGVSLERMLAAAAAVREVLGRPLGSHTLLAGPIDWHPVA